MVTKKQTKIIEWISFLGLCILAIYFMWGVMGKFLSNKTSFTQTEEPMKELPTIVFCFSKVGSYETEYEYGSDVEINYGLFVTYGEYHNVTLKEGENTTLLSETVHLEKLRGYLGNCYKIITMLSDMKLLKQYTYSAFKVYFNESIINKDKPTLKVYFTSKRNAYGAISVMWKDGKVARNQIEKGTYKELELKSVQHTYLASNSKCSDESFYECFSRLLSKKLEDKSVKKCSPSSLPNLQVCENRTTNKEIFAQVPTEIIKHELCPKLCNILEFYVEESFSITNNLPSDFSDNGFNANTYGFSYTFHTSDTVTVHEEYLIYDAISMIGSVGGTLGMCIGFSFTGLISCLMHNVFKICNNTKMVKHDGDHIIVLSKLQDKNVESTLELLEKMVEMKIDQKLNSRFRVL